MEIQEIKSKLTLSEVIKHYGLKADKHNRICCPFHEDKTPSMQLYYKTHTAYCFSASCPTHGHSMDVIEMVTKLEKTDKRNGILKCVSMINGSNGTTTLQPTTISREQFLQQLFTYFKNAVHNSPPAKEYLQKRNLDFKKIEVGYNAGQFHHGARKEETLINQALQYGLLIDKNLIARTGEKAYQPFGKWCVVFALRNYKDEVTGLYFRSTLNDKEQRHFYLKNRSGLYPSYPAAATKKIILTESIIDAVTLLQQKEIAETYSLLALYGTNGLTEEHTTAITSLKHLDEIIFWLNADDAGKQAVNKYAAMFKELLPQVKITNIELPDNEDINSIAQGHEANILNYYINERKLFFSVEKKEVEAAKLYIEITKPANVQPKPPATTSIFNADNPYNIIYKGIAAEYQIKGGIKPQMDSLKVSLQIIHYETKQDYRTKIDLYEYKQVSSTAQQAAEKLGIRSDTAEKDLSQLTNHAEQYRDEHLQTTTAEKPQIKVSETGIVKCIEFMSKPNLISNINTLIGKAGVTGEETNRIFLFCIASSYKMKDTLHALVQGSSGSGKTHLIIKVAGLMPQEDVTMLTRVTESSFYNYGENDLVHTLLCFEDLDGMKEEALLALRELASREILTSSTSVKDENGNIRAAIKTVRGPIASLSATTRGEIYEDNMSRSFLIAVDESKEQTKKIIQYQNDKAAGLIDTQKEKDIKEFLQNCIRLLKPYEVVNPFANKIQLPEDAHKIRRLNELYQAFVKQITLLNQYQRKKDEKGRLIAQKEDLKIACDIMFESILLKVDELDGSLRQYFEQIKTYINSKGKEYEFTRIELRQQLKMSKTLQHNYINKLIELEYIRQSGGHINRGYHYKIIHWDNMAALRAKLKDGLANQLQHL